MDNNSITFVVTNYNKSKYVEKCINSILNQTDVNDCIIIIDDCSTDNSKEIIEKYNKYQNINFIENSINYGVSYSRNLGINNANTKFITFIDSDDTISDGYIKDIKNNFINAVQCVCYGFNFVDSISENQNEQCIYLDDALSNIDKIIKLEDSGLFASACNKIYLLDYIRKNKICFNVNSKIMEDYEFNLKYFENIKKIKVSNKCFYNYYYYGDISASSKYKADLLNRYYELRDLRKQFYQKYDLNDFATKYNIDFLKICINNLYKDDSKLNSISRKKMLKEIILLDDYKIWKHRKCNGILDKILKVAFFTNNVEIIDFNMKTLHYIKNNSAIAHNYFKKKNKKR